MFFLWIKLQNDGNHWKRIKGMIKSSLNGILFDLFVCLVRFDNNKRSLCCVFLFVNELIYVNIQKVKQDLSISNFPMLNIIKYPSIQPPVLVLCVLRPLAAPRTIYGSITPREAPSSKSFGMFSFLAIFFHSEFCFHLLLLK